MQTDWDGEYECLNFFRTIHHVIYPHAHQQNGVAK
jgi:hypothetical protein